MNSKKVYLGMLGLVGLLTICGIAAVVLGNSMLQKKSHELVGLKLENRVLEEQQVALVQANKDIEKYSELEGIAKSIVPQDKDQAKSVREIVSIAEQSGVSISSITFPISNLGTAAPKPTATNTENKDDAAKPATPAAPPVTQVKAVDGIKGVYQLEIRLDSGNQTSYASLIDFLSRLEQNRRTAQVTQIEIQPDSATGGLKFSLVINVYIKP